MFTHFGNACRVSIFTNAGTDPPNPCERPNCSRCVEIYDQFKMIRTTFWYTRNSICDSCWSCMDRGTFRELGEQLWSCHDQPQNILQGISRERCVLCSLLLLAKCQQADDLSRQRSAPSSDSILNPPGERIGSLDDLILFSPGTMPTTLGTHTDCFIRVVPRGQVNMKMLSQWLNTCENQHGSYCAKRYLGDDVSNISLIVVDAEQKMLATAPPQCRYIALSYVWGNVPQLQLTVENKVELFSNGGLQNYWDQIPQVIRDAIEVVSGIGERYLWVDSLCICQNEPIQKHEQINNMGNIYSGALTTIVAAASGNAAEGLPGVQLNSRRIVDIGVCSDIHLAKREPFRDVISKSTYDIRGWTYQERLLSKRCIYFSGQQVFFQCKQEICSEDRWEDGWVRQRSVCSDNATITFGFGKLNSVSHPPRELHHIFNDYYALFVMEYSQKKLSYDSDILNAFAGICQYLANYFWFDFCCGFPLDNTLFQSALFWYHPKEGVRRRSEDEHSNTFPSWSWCGWVGQVYFEPHHPATLHGPILLRGAKQAVCMEPAGDAMSSGVLNDPSTPTLETYPTLQVADDEWLEKEFFSNKMNVLHFWSFTLPVRSFRYEKVESCPASTSSLSTRRDYRALLFTEDEWCCGGLFGFDADTLSSTAAMEWEFVLLSVAAGGCTSDHDTTPCICPAFCRVHALGGSLKGVSSEIKEKEMDNREGSDDVQIGIQSKGKEESESESESKRDGEMSCMRRVLIVKWEGKYAYRVGIGMVHKTAWAAAKPTMKFIRLS